MRSFPTAETSRGQGTSPLIGMLCWEAATIPRGLNDLAELPGNATHPGTFPFAVRYVRVAGANLHTVLECPAASTLEAMVEAARQMVQQGVRAITTSCGFNAIFQRELAEAVSVPVFTSSLLQVPLVRLMLRRDQPVGIITAKKAALTEGHLRAAGIAADTPLRIAGLENAPQWNKIFTAPGCAVDLEAIAAEVVDTARRMAGESPRLGAIVLECTDLPPFAGAIRKATGLPVFDIVTLVHLVHDAVAGANFAGHYCPALG